MLFAQQHAVEAAPLTRGSTRRGESQAGAFCGCPAHAGIDPCKTCCCPSAPRLPRSRGDRPAALIDEMRSFPAAPLTRGSTPGARRQAPVVLGCPAHAGINLDDMSLSVGASRLPRSRGDRPRDGRTPLPRVTAAPLTRGSTHPDLGRRGAAPGCPAHAGIDPGTVWYPQAPLWLPRSRGDRPPACGSVDNDVQAAPLTRGSTRRAVGQHRRHRGCPAHAGIDPPVYASAPAHQRLPRSRGDRPRRAAGRYRRRRAAPLTRGST